MKSIQILFLIVLSTSALGQPVLKMEEISDDIEMLVPSELTRSPISLQRTTSPALALFNSRDGQVDLGVNIAQLRWGASDLELLSQFYKANILNLYDEVHMHEEGLKDINGRPFIVFEFSGQLVDQANAFSERRVQTDYTYIMYHVRSDGVLIFRFTSPERQRRYWQKSVRELMESVSFSEKKRKK